MPENELRAGLVDAVEQFRADLAIGRHGDPHVGFVVLVHSDAPPDIVIIAEAGAHDISRIKQSSPGEPPRTGGGRFFHMADLDAAANALRDAAGVIRYRSRGLGGEETLGQAIVAEIRQRWQDRIDHTINTMLAKAGDEARRSAVCDGCKRRFTERGLSAHHARNRWCPAARAQQEGATSVDAEHKASEQS